MELEERVAKLEETFKAEEKIARFERITTRIGGLLILLVTLLMIILNKLDDVVLAIIRVISHALGR